MRRFSCHDCGAEVHFTNLKCTHCSADLVYLTASDLILTGPVTAPKRYNGIDGYTPCANRERIGCNWLSPPTSETQLCSSCSHTIKIPNLSDFQKKQQWSRLERAKRRLFYALIKFGLTPEKEASRVDGTLRFELIGDRFTKDGERNRVMTGHDNGLITINIAEADDAVREKNRTAMGEPYRTLIGHFRHEIGHYFWDQLVDLPDMIERFRSIFGDERADYSDALKAYYACGPASDWQKNYVSAYSTSHPWEDFAETWAHYFHMISGLETAFAYGLNPQPLTTGAPPNEQIIDPYKVYDFDQLLPHWIPITVAMNAMNRSIGHNDYYPFVLSDNISAKLSFIHDLIKLRGNS